MGRLGRVIRLSLAGNGDLLHGSARRGVPRCLTIRSWSAQAGGCTTTAENFTRISHPGLRRASRPADRLGSTSKCPLWVRSSARGRSEGRERFNLASRAATFQALGHVHPLTRLPALRAQLFCHRRQETRRPLPAPILRRVSPTCPMAINWHSVTNPFISASTHGTISSLIR